MRGLVKSAAASLGAAAVLMTGCGVAAPRNVASIDGVGVTMEQVLSTARDPLYGIISPDSDDPTMSGDSARQALMANVERAVWVAEARRWGLDTTSKRADAEKTLDDQLAAMPEPMDLSKDVREGFIDLFAAEAALQERFAKIDPTDDSDLRLIYDLSPTLWNRTCAFIVVIPDGAEDEVGALVRRGAGAEEVSERVDGAEIVTSPEDDCMSEGSIPLQIRDDLRTVPVGSADVFELDSGGMIQYFMVEVVSRETVGFEDARQDLMGIAAALVQGGPQQWVQLRLVETTVDPRFGAGISVGGQGQSFVVPPSGPIQPRPSFDDLGFGPIEG